MEMRGIQAAGELHLGSQRQEYGPRTAKDCSPITGLFTTPSWSKYCKLSFRLSEGGIFPVVFGVRYVM